ncbi:MAG: ubiquitin-conjugating enzyme E2 [Planctomycetota bacterium]|jgi:ubiquitin-protein ligase
MTPRLRRLAADHAQVIEAFKGNPHIRPVRAWGKPPERYEFEFRVKGLVEGGGGDLVTTSSHKAEVFLPSDYPRRAPFCRMTTPVFHPNIDPQKICIGDHWSAGQSLPQLVVRIAEMICYQSYNTKSPLNAKAAAWAEKNVSRLPVQDADLSAGI